MRSIQPAPRASPRSAPRSAPAAAAGPWRRATSSRSRSRSTTVSGRAARTLPGGRRATTGWARRGGAPDELPVHAQPAQRAPVGDGLQPRQQLVLLVPDVLSEHRGQPVEQRPTCGVVQVELLEAGDELVDLLVL